MATSNPVAYSLRYQQGPHVSVRRREPLRTTNPPHLALGTSARQPVKWEVDAPRYSPVREVRGVKALRLVGTFAPTLAWDPVRYPQILCSRPVRDGTRPCRGLATPSLAMSWRYGRQASCPSDFRICAVLPTSVHSLCPPCRVRLCLPRCRRSCRLVCLLMGCQRHRRRCLLRWRYRHPRPRRRLVSSTASPW